MSSQQNRSDPARHAAQRAAAHRAAYRAARDLIAAHRAEFDRALAREVAIESTGEPEHVEARWVEMKIERRRARLREAGQGE